MREVTCYTKENGNYVKIDVDPEVASKAYKDYASRNIREFDLRVKFNKKTISSSDIVSIRINSDLFTTDSFTIGSVVAETLELTIYMDTVFGTDNFTHVDDWVIDKWRPIIPYVLLRTEIEIQTEYGFELKEVWQEVNLGPFYINPDGINEDGIGVMSIRASTLFTHPKYSNAVLDMPAKVDRTLYKLVDLSRKAVNNSSTNSVFFTLLNTDLPEDVIAKYDNIADMTVREAINYVAILYGGYARTIYKNDTVYLEFFRKQQTDYIFDESNYVFLTRGGSGSGLTLTELKCKVSNIQTLVVGSGADETQTIFLECPDMTQERLYAILTEFNKYSFRPTTSKIFGNPMLQVGDITTVRGRGISSGGANFPLHSIVYNITGSGITMDVKALFKVNEIDRKEKQAEEDNKEENNKENLQQSLDELYDRTTIQYEDKDKNLPLITLKEDYLETKDSLMDDIEGLGNSYTSLNKKLEDHLKNPGNTGTSANPIEFYTNNELVGKIGSNTHKSGDNETESTQQLYLSLMQEKDMLNICNGSIIATGRPNGVGYDGHHCFQGLNLANPHIVPHGQGGTTMTLTAWMETYLDSYGNCIGSGELSVGTYSNFYVSGGYELSLCLHGRTNQYSDHSYHIAMQFYAKNYDPSNIGMYLNVDTDATNHTVSNVYIANTVSSQSEYTANLINSGTNENIMHSNLSYDSGELRWCHKENVFTYAESDIDPETDQWVYTGRYICYVELPIFMAENIQNDYHINICKMSWGDYRIIEKNPYYFILESQEDNFAFTFEVVAKLNDNQTLDANASIAGYSYRHYDKNSEQEQE